MLERAVAGLPGSLRQTCASLTRQTTSTTFVSHQETGWRS